MYNSCSQKAFVRAVCVSKQKGIAKSEVPSAVLTEEWGLTGDAHGGNWQRQVSLLAEESVDRMRGNGVDLPPGIFAENLLTRGIDLKSIPVGTVLQIGSALLRVTQIGKECHTDCAIRKKAGTCVMPAEGIFATVQKGGTIRPGDRITIRLNGISDPEDSERRQPMTIHNDSFTASVITVSDHCAHGDREDISGPLLAGLLTEAGYTVTEQLIVPDEQDRIASALIHAADQDIALIVTTGGTGFAPRDVTPEATAAVCEKMVPGIPEAMRTKSMEITPRGCLSRGTAGIRGRSLIVNLPGSPKAIRENLDVLLPPAAHGLRILREKETDCAAE